MKLKYLTLALMALPMTTLADVEQNTVQFSTSVTKEVTPDLMQVRVYVQEEGNDLKALNQKVADKLNQALKLIKGQPAVEIQSNNRQTYPRYNNKISQQNGWIENGEFILQSKDSVALSQLIHDLSPILAIDNVNSIVSNEALQQVEDEMMQQALTKFKHKATLIQNSLQAKGYEIVEISVDTPAEMGGHPRPYMMMAKSAVSDSEPVQLESGKTNLKARVDGKIKLIK